MVNPNKLMASFSNQLSLWMKQKQLTQAFLSQKTGIPQPMISRILSGRWNNITLETLQKISSMFGMGVDLNFTPLGAAGESGDRKPPYSSACFWDVDPEAMKMPDHAFFAAERILSFGKQAEIRWLMKNISAETIKSVIKESRSLTPKSGAFWGMIFGIPQKEIQCLKRH